MYDACTYAGDIFQLQLPTWILLI